MKTGPGFWRALERVGTSGAARADWRLLLGDGWREARALLRPRAPVEFAETIIDPRDPRRRLLVVDDRDGSFAAVGEESPLPPPIDLAEADVVVLEPEWRAIGRALGAEIGFVAGDWAGEGQTRQVGIAQPRRGEIRPVHLHMPSGSVGASIRLLRDIAGLRDAIVLVPLARILSPDIVRLARERGIQFAALAERLEQEEARRGSVIARAASSEATVKRSRGAAPILDVGPGWRWEDIAIVVDPAGRMIASRGRERGEFRFRARAGRGFSQDLRILVRIAVDGAWRNPPSEASDHESARKAFARMCKRLRAIIPVAGEPFDRSQDGWHPRFKLSLSSGLRDALQERKWL